MAATRNRQNPHEHRITWQRDGWVHSQSRKFARLRDAEAFLARLEGGDRTDLAPIILLEHHRRDVGPWEAA
jgi:hypothetical protein